MINFILMVNKQGQTRLAQYFQFLSVKERMTLEGELIRKCLSRNESQCSFVEHRGYKVYLKYKNYNFKRLFIEDTHPYISQLEWIQKKRYQKIQNIFYQNEMAYLEFIHNLVETLDKYFENVVYINHMLVRIGCKLQFLQKIMYNIEKAHYILEEMVMNGQIVETNKTQILAPIAVIDKAKDE